MKTQIQFQPLLASMIVVLMSITFNTSAQESKASKKLSGGFGYFQIGYASFDNGDLNTLLKAYDMPELDKGSVSFGGGGHSIINNFIVGGEGHGLIGSRSVNDNYSISQSGGYGFFNVGYLLLKKSFITLYPILGLGGGGYSVSITDKSNLPTNFNDLLDNPGNQSLLSKGGFMLNFSLGTDFLVAGSVSDKGMGGFILGLRAGYMLDLNKDKWYISDQQLADGPEAGMSGAYIRLTIGGGGIAK